MRNVWKVLMVTGLLALVQLACNLPTMAPEANGTPGVGTGTPGAGTLSPTFDQLLTGTAPNPSLATATVGPGTGQPVDGPTPGGQGANCIYKATFVEDVTIPDNTTIPAGQNFVKTWRVRNDGTCTWGPTGHNLHALAFTSGNQLGAPEEVPLPSNVEPGQSLDVSVTMRAPTVPGTYLSSWLFRVDGDAAGVNWIGIGPNGDQPLYALIKVGQ